jgi:3-hydroxyacyl-CoA dehydrogenase
MREIRRVAVIGAGVMGAGIAAQVANAGVPVVLLDVLSVAGTDRNAIAARALQAMATADPPPLMSKAAAALITPGNTVDHLAALAECDWIIEAVSERLDIKQALYRAIDGVRRSGSAVSSNTSTIPLAALLHGLPDRFAAEFCITHFFNPPRYMRLVEVVRGAATRSEVIDTVRRFADLRLGKRVIPAKDRPGFIANRMGVFWLQCAVVEAFEQGLEVEEADAVIGPPLGIPKTGVFGLLDLIGLDLMPQVVASMVSLLPDADPLHAVHRPLPLVERMAADGYTGRKGKGGFYRLDRTAGGKVRQAMSLGSGQYRLAAPVDPAVIGKADVKALFARDDRLGRYAWRVMGRTLAYAASLVPEAADEITSVDQAMRLGYNWTRGPFELIDQMGAGWLAERLSADGMPVPELLKSAGGRPFYRVDQGRRRYLGADGGYHAVRQPDGVLLLADVKLSRPPVVKNGSAALWDIGDGAACFEFTTKMNVIDPDVLRLLQDSLAVVASRFKALVVYNEGSNFSAGVNLGLALFAANIAAWPDIERIVALGQQTYRALKYAPFPVVGAPSGLALGGGCEILLHCDAVQAHAETYMGLVECGVGLVPAWGGCTEMLDRWSSHPAWAKGPMPAVAKVFETLATATVARSASDAKELLFLRPTDGITMNRDRLLADAKARALALVDGYAAPTPRHFVLPGPSGGLALTMMADSLRRRGLATAHDLVVSQGLASVLSGGDDADLSRPLAEDRLLAEERRQFMRLIRHPLTLARVESVLETGKPLRT